jgi:hypothetical protein
MWSSAEVLGPPQLGRRTGEFSRLGELIRVCDSQQL